MSSIKKLSCNLGQAPRGLSQTAVISFFLLLILFPVSGRAEKTADAGSGKNEAASATASASSSSQANDPAIKKLVFKMMVVNPSDKRTQKYPIEAYLPQETKEEDILDTQGLDIKYSADKKAYYLAKEIELQPGETVVKEIKIKDIWLIAESELEARSEEAKSLESKLRGTKYEEQGRMLLTNIEVMLTRIFELQNKAPVTPAEHVGIYRTNKEKLDGIELDLMALRRLILTVGDASLLPGFMKSKAGETPKFLKDWADDAAKRNSGAVPAWVLWKMIFGIMMVLGVASMSFLWTCQRLAHIIEARKRQMIVEASVEKKAEEYKIGDFLSGDPDKNNVAA